MFTNVTSISLGQDVDNISKTTEVIFEAEIVEIKKQEGIIIAKDNVLFEQGQYKLRADI